MVGAACPRVPVQLVLRVPAAEQVCQEVGERRHPGKPLVGAALHTVTQYSIN